MTVMNKESITVQIKRYVESGLIDYQDLIDMGLAMQREYVNAQRKMIDEYIKAYKANIKAPKLQVSYTNANAVHLNNHSSPNMYLRLCSSNSEHQIKHYETRNIIANHVVGLANGQKERLLNE